MDAAGVAEIFAAATAKPLTWKRRDASTLSFGTQRNTATKNSSIKRGLEYHRRVYQSLRVWRRLNAPELQLHVEPWLERSDRRLRQPDAVVIDPASRSGIVIEVKLNWKDGRDTKLIEEYLDAVAEAFSVTTFPLLITQNIRGLKHKPMLGLGAIERSYGWQPGQNTPVILLP